MTERFINGPEIIERIKSADHNEDDWFYPILEDVQDDFTRGYLTHAVEGIFDNHTGDDARDEILWLTEDMAEYQERG